MEFRLDLLFNPYKMSLKFLKLTIICAVGLLILDAAIVVFFALK